MKTLFAILLFALTALPAEAQWRGDHSGWGHGGGWQNRGGGGWGGGGNFGGAVLGGVIGGMIGGAISQPRPYYQPQPTYVDPFVYCSQRFRSYNPETGLYFGFDGRYHPCP
jgi:BA14K-like protein